MMEPIKVNVHRGDLIESVHLVDAVVVDADGRVLVAAGEPERITYWRSAAKPFQALSFVEAGGLKTFDLTGAEVAVMCASHSGEPEHTQRVQRVLKEIGLTEEALQCGAHAPLHQESAVALYKRGGEPTPIHNNCSGKHSGMLAHSVLIGADLNTYFHLDHPVQKSIVEVVARYTGVSKDELIYGVDGCGVPVFGLSLQGMATAYARLAANASKGASDKEEGQAAATVVQAMQDHPHLVAGTGRICTRLMAALAPWVVAKGGAEGVYCVGMIPWGIGVALKVRDGAERATGPAIARMLQAITDQPPGVSNSDEARQVLKDLAEPAIHNHAGTLVGKMNVEMSDQLLEGLKNFTNI